MDDDSGYINWQDFFTGNQQGAEGMAQGLVDQLHDGGKSDPATIEAMSEKHFGAARGMGEGTDAGEYGRTGEAARTGAMSYGEAARRLQDPHERQSLLAKQYAGHRVTTTDAALAGQAGGERFDAEAKNAKALQTRVESRAIDAEGRMTRYRNQMAAQKEADAADVQRRQANHDAHQKTTKQRAIDDENRAVDSFGRKQEGAKYNPNGVRSSPINFNIGGQATMPETSNRDYWRNHLNKQRSGEETTAGAMAVGAPAPKTWHVDANGDGYWA